MSEPHIMVVDDARDIRDPLGAYLRRHGYRVSPAADAAVARKLMATSAIDLVILDVMMPGESGLALCRYIRECRDIPIILLTAMAESMDRIVGLEIGADDYVTKPFDPRELLARIRNVLRRSTALPRQRDHEKGRRFVFARWTFDTDRRELSDESGAVVPLSTGEARLLAALALRPRVTLSRDQLLDLTSGRAAQAFERSIDNQISRLRRKLERDPSQPAILQTVWGGGYILATDVKELA
jgi:two-component system, OmpR family, response regulator